jgi:NodT family efflux transporter outer membrane factor (OMF) lipoprotein
MEAALKLALLWAVASLLLLTGGCMVGPNYHAPRTQVPPGFDSEWVPGSTAAATQPSAKPTSRPIDIAHWWQSLDDPELNALVDRAIAGNFDLKRAVSRLQQARALDYAAGGGTVPGIGAVPSINMSAGAGRGSGTNTARGRVDAPLHAGTNTNGLQEITHVAGFDAAWELDLFGRYSRELEAVRADTQAAYEARNEVLISVVADVVRTYTDLRARQLRLEIARENEMAQSDITRRVRLKFQRQIGRELDVALAETQLATATAEIEPLEASIGQAERQLAVLLGLYPEQLRAELERPTPLPSTPPRVSAGMPIQLLRRRPDIRRSERELAAATARIGVATADLFPRVAITGGAGFQGQGLGRTPVQNSMVWSIGPTFYWPFLDFGTLDALVQVQDYRTRELFLGYQQTVVTAVREVDDALSNYAAQQSQLSDLANAVEASQRAARLAQQGWNIGLVDFLYVLDAQRQLYALEDRYAIAQASLVQQFVLLYKALGGGWEGYEAAPPPKPPLPALFAAGARTIGGAGATGRPQ